MFCIVLLCKLTPFAYLHDVKMSTGATLTNGGIWFVKDYGGVTFHPVAHQELIHLKPIDLEPAYPKPITLPHHRGQGQIHGWVCHHELW